MIEKEAISAGRASRILSGIPRLRQIRVKAARLGELLCLDSGRCHTAMEKHPALDVST